MFGSKGFWGLDLGESGIKAVKLRREGKNVVIEDSLILNYADLQTNPPAERFELMSRAVAQLAGRMRRSDVAVAGIPSENVLSRFIGLPPVDKRRIPEIVRYEARQQIPFDLSEVQWDYQRVREELVPGEEIEIGLFAVRREVIEHFLSALGSVASHLQALTINPLSVFNFVSYDQRPDKPLIVLDIGAKSTDLIVIDGPKFWIRNLPIAGNSFTQALQKKFNISAEEAENVKLRVEQSRHRAQIFEVIEPVIHDLVGEIQRSIGYYKTLSRDVKFEEILAMGQSLNLFGLQRMMAEDLRYNIRQVGRPKQIGVDANQEEKVGKSAATFASAIGAALMGMKAGGATVNLLPMQFLQRRELNRKQVPAVAVGVLLWMAAGVAFLQSAGTISKLKDLTNVGDAALKRYEQVVRDYGGQPQPPAGLTKYQKLTQWREFWPIITDGAMRSIPPGVHVSPLEIISQGTTASTDTVIDFDATASVSRRQVYLEKTLIDYLKHASVYPEKVPLYKSVALTDEVRPTNGAQDLHAPVECFVNKAPDLERMRVDAAYRAACWKRLGIDITAKDAGAKPAGDKEVNVPDANAK